MRCSVTVTRSSLMRGWWEFGAVVGEFGGGCVAEPLGLDRRMLSCGNEQIGIASSPTRAIFHGDRPTGCVLLGRANGIHEEIYSQHPIYLSYTSPLPG
jgi:hypothetical protein